MEVWNDTQEEMEQWEVIDLDLFFCLRDNRHQLNMCNKTPGGMNVGCIGTHSHLGPLICGQLKFNVDSVQHDKRCYFSLLAEVLNTRKSQEKGLC